MDSATEGIHFSTWDLGCTRAAQPEAPDLSPTMTDLSHSKTGFGKSARRRARRLLCARVDEERPNPA